MFSFRWGLSTFHIVNDNIRSVLVRDANNDPGGCQESETTTAIPSHANKRGVTQYLRHLACVCGFPAEHQVSDVLYSIIWIFRGAGRGEPKLGRETSPASQGGANADRPRAEEIPSATDPPTTDSLPRREADPPQKDGQQAHAPSQN